MHTLIGKSGEELKEKASSFLTSNGDYGAMFFEGAERPIFIPTDPDDIRAARIDVHLAEHGAVVKALGEDGQTIDVNGDHLYKHASRKVALFEWTGFWALTMSTDGDHMTVLMPDDSGDVRAAVVPPVDNIDEHVKTVLELLGV